MANIDWSIVDNHRPLSHETAVLRALRNRLLSLQELADETGIESATLEKTIGALLKVPLIEEETTSGAATTADFLMYAPAEVVGYRLHENGEQLLRRLGVSGDDTAGKIPESDHVKTMTGLHLRRNDFTEEDRRPGDWRKIFADESGMELPYSTWHDRIKGKKGVLIRVVGRRNQFYYVHKDDLPDGAKSKPQRERILKRTP